MLLVKNNLYLPSTSLVPITASKLTYMCSFSKKSSPFSSASNVRSSSTEASVASHKVMHNVPHSTRIAFKAAFIVFLCVKMYIWHFLKVCLAVSAVTVVFFWSSFHSVCLREVLRDHDKCVCVCVSLYSTRAITWRAGSWSVDLSSPDVFTSCPFMLHLTSYTSIHNINKLPHSTRGVCVAANQRRGGQAHTHHKVISVLKGPTCEWVRHWQQRDHGINQPESVFDHGIQSTSISPGDQYSD